MSDDLLAGLRVDLERVEQERDQLIALIARLEGRTDDGDGRLTVPLAPFLAENNLEWEWLFGSVIPTGATCILAGEGKVAGKTTLILQMSLCLAAGKSPFYDCPVSRSAKTLYVAAEGARAALQHRIRTCARSMGISPDVISDLWHVQKKDATDYMLGSRALEKMIDESGAALVVLDTIKYFHKGNNNDATDWVRHVMTPARALTAKYGCAFVFVDHMSKPTPERKGLHRIGGTKSKSDDCDVIMELEPPQGEPLSDKRRLSLTTKYAEPRCWDLRVDFTSARFG